MGKKYLAGVFDYRNLRRRIDYAILSRDTTQLKETFRIILSAPASLRGVEPRSRGLVKSYWDYALTCNEDRGLNRIRRCLVSLNLGELEEQLGFLGELADFMLYIGRQRREDGDMGFVNLAS